MSDISDLVESLPPEHIDAVNIIATFIRCYNSKDGIGLFAGISRYSQLEARCRIAAVQSGTLLDFWSNLRQKLLCPIPQIKYDKDILAACHKKQDQQTLKYLATRTAECVMLAREIVSETKKTVSDDKNALWKEVGEIMGGDELGAGW
jgi:hypothetical protein